MSDVETSLTGVQNPMAKHDGRHLLSRLPTRRWTRFALAVAVAVAMLLVVRAIVQFRASRWQGSEHTNDIPSSEPLFPPLYPEYHQMELDLPQHNLNLPPPEGKNGKYLWIANHVVALGWGNVLQEQLFNSYLAYKAGRAFVFDNYTWNRDGGVYSGYGGNLIPSKIPLSAMITGPTIGGPFPAGDRAPRSVGREYWEQVCPHPTIINSREIADKLPDKHTAGQLEKAWLEKLATVEDHCVEIERDSPQIFGYWIFGEADRLLDIWPSVQASPIITEFGWSDLVLSAFDNNRHLFAPATFWEKHFSLSDPRASIPGFLVIHLRRGDFEDHCGHLAEWSARWNGFNRFPGFPDKWVVPEGAGDGEHPPTDAALAAYLKACYPNIEQIVEKVEAVKKSDAGRGLENIYIMTNGARDWLVDLKKALKKTGSWNHVATTRDLKLTWDQKHISHAVDMHIGQRAQVFIGNGFSSMTSNIVMLRMARQLPTDSNRFW